MVFIDTPLYSPHSTTPPSSQVRQKGNYVRFRIAALCGLLCLFGSEVQAQSNQLSFPDITARPGEERTVALSGTFVGGMSGLVITILFNPSVIQVLDVTTATLTSDFTLQSSVSNGRLTIAMAAAQPVTTVFPEWLLDLHVRVIGAPGTVTGLDLISVVVNEGEATASTVDGSLTIVREASILGWVLYYADLQAVPNVVLTATGAATIADTTDTDGRYQIGPTPVGDYDIEMSRANGSLAAIDALDAADILRHLIGELTLSPDQAFAADVSGNGIIGTTDAALILRFLVGLESGFPAGSFWQFKPGALQFQPLIQDEFRNFTAYLMGDVDGSWDTAGGTGKRLAAATPSLHLQRLPAAQEGKLELLLRAQDLTSMRGGTLELAYDADALRAIEVSRQDLGPEFLLVSNLDQPGVLRLAFAGTAGLQGDAGLVKILFDERGQRGVTTQVAVRSARLNRAGLTPSGLGSLTHELGRPLADVNGDGLIDLSDFFLLIDSIGTYETRYDLNADQVVDMSDIFILFDELGTGRPKAIALAAQLGSVAQPALLPNAPNPFNSSTVIPYEIAVDGQVALHVYDLLGQRVRDLASGDLTAGPYSVTWDGQDNSGHAVASGTYILRLHSPTGVAQRKVLLLR